MKSLEELSEKRFPHYILWAVLAFFIILIIWASFSDIEESASATGTVIPSSKVKVIQNLEGGIVKNIFVKEGQTLKKGKVLMQLSEVQFSSDFGVNKKNRAELQVKIDRLRAQIAGTEFKPTPKQTKNLPKTVRSEQQLYTSKIQELKLLLKRQSLIQREINITRPLIKSGAVSKVEVLRLEQTMSEIQGKIHAFKSSMLDELSKAIDEQNELIEQANKFKDRLQRTTIVSPVNGIVKQIYVNTIGGVIKPGMPIMEIVPIADTLLVEVRLNPNDIGFIKIGQPALVKITAYDYAVYGGLEGKVEHISADTSQDKEGVSYYEVWVRTDKAYLGKDKTKLRIIPGMQASVSIITGKKSVLTYLMKPILRAKEKALTER